MRAKATFRWLAAVALLSSPGGRAGASETVPPVPGSVERTRCNDFNDGQIAWAMVAAGSEEPLPLRSLSPPVLLPDGSSFKTWEQPGEHRRTFFVAQRHPQAADDNPGTEDKPWKTIGRAAGLLEPGDRVIVKQGLYREWVRPARGGSCPKRMITYQAAPGQQVILSGSEPLEGRWAASALAGHAPPAKAWMIDLPATLFEGYHPFAQSNLQDIATGPYADKVWKRPPYTLPRGLVFQTGRRLAQVARYEELAERSGAYWVEPGGRRLHLRPIDDLPPREAAWEVSTRPFAFAPRTPGLGFIRLEGFTIEHVANCYPVPQLGAVSTMQGHHWIVENNLVRQVNGLGLDYGRLHTFLPRPVPPSTPKLGGAGTIVRGNAFFECGICALSGLGLIGGLVEDNYSSGCGWHDVPELCETGGIKLHYMKHSLVRRNVVEGTIGAPGLWVDHSNVNTRVTANIVVKARTAGWGGIFLEASYRPNLIDHNIVWDCDGHAFYQHDCGELIVTNNLFGCCTKLPVLMRKSGNRLVDIETRRISKSERNRVLGNVFYGFEDRGPEVPDGMANLSDYNVFANPPGARSFDLAAWQKRTGREMHSITFAARMELTLATWTLRQAPVLPVFQGPRIFELTRDYFGTALPVSDTAQAGPFVPENLRPEVVLRTKVPR